MAPEPGGKASVPLSLSVWSCVRFSLADECRQVHFHLPYKWEVLDSGTWTDLQHTEDMERDFCDPSKTQRSEVMSQLHFRFKHRKK